MKEIYILEHADWNEEKEMLTERGKQECYALKHRVPAFNLVYSSKSEKTKKTAEGITDKKPKVDSRAGESRNFVWWEEEEKDPKGSSLVGIYGGVSQPESYRVPVIKAGEELLNLVKEVFKKLPKDGKGLIISHNRNMIAAEAILKKERMVSYGHTFHSLQGFIIDEKMNLTECKEFD